MTDQPFALVGFNCNNKDAKKLKEVMEKEKLNWRSFTARDDVLKSWNNPGTPGYYVIDHTGVIRYKWMGDNPGEKAIDAAIKKLIKKAKSG